MEKFAVGFVGAKGQHTVFHGVVENVELNIKPFLLEQRQARVEGSYQYTLTKRYFATEEGMLNHIQNLKSTYSGIADGSKDISPILNLVTV